jgi:phosphohistidine phosphatase SixA
MLLDMISYYRKKILFFIFCLPCLLLENTVYADENLWEKLQQQPNMIVFIRNTESTGNKDGSNMLTWDKTGQCQGESTLTENGESQAKKIGELFKQHEVNPVVISSPMCRCKQTAELAFGQFITSPPLIQANSSDLEKQALFHSRATELILKHKGKTPIVFINHRPNINSLTMEMISLGDLLVGTVLDDGEIEILGKMHLPD